MNHCFVLVVSAVIASAACDGRDDASLPPTTLLTGTSPNAVALTRCGNRGVALVAASGEARLDVIDLRSGDAASAVFAVGSNPWDVAVVDTVSGPRAVVSLYGTHELALVDPCAAPPAVLQTIGDDEPIVVNPATTADDGTVITSMTPRNAQAVAVADDVVWLAWTNIIEFVLGDQPMQTGPGLLSRFRLVDDLLVADGRTILPCENPAAINADSARIVVACTGRYKNSSTGFARASDGALVVVDANSLDLVAAVDLDASPVSLLVHGGDIIVGDALDGTVTRFDTELVQQQQTPTSTGIESVFALDVVDNVVVAAVYGASDILLVDPFGAAARQPVIAGTARGVVDLVHDDSDFFILMSISAQLLRRAHADVLVTP